MNRKRIAQPATARPCIDQDHQQITDLANSVSLDDRMCFARAAAFSAISAYWETLQAATGWNWPLRELPEDTKLLSVSNEVAAAAKRIGSAAAQLDTADASYAIGVIYITLMPGGVRSRLGAYYTPPALCEALLNLADEAGIDWKSARVLDPACGGGAFLSPVALRMADSLGKAKCAKAALQDIESRLRGFELVPFAAWMSQVFLDVTLGRLCHEAGTRLRPVVEICDSLERVPQGTGFDLVIGNPPYGRVKLAPELRKKFGRSLYGHANLYGVFTDLALRLASQGGVIAYVTPTSFLSGEYFKALRDLLGKEAPPVGIDFVAMRKGVFADVLQETLLAAYKRGGAPLPGNVHLISSSGNGSVSRKFAGTFQIPEKPDRPWLMPRAETQSSLVRRANEFPSRLADYGYTVSTGPLVWNRHKASMRNRSGNGRFPLIWAESVRPEGVFSFRAEKRNHKPFFEPREKEKWVVTNETCVLLQRTTAKEQCRRLIAAELPAQFIREHGAVVVENHLNMIRPLNGTPRVAPSVVAAILNSSVVDQVFRCMNGSVAVSAYELEALPLPRPEQIKEIERLVEEKAGKAALESAVCNLYRGAAEDSHPV